MFTFLFLLQEDDIEGIHIVAFAEEEDPGEKMLLINPKVRNYRSFPF